MIKTVLFDLDGTLIQTPSAILKSFEIIFKSHLSHVKVDQKTLSSFLGQSLFKTFGLYVDHEKEIEHLVSEYRKVSEALLKDGVKAYPNARSTIEYLKQHRINVGVVTSKLRTVALKHIEMAGLSGLFDVVIGYEDVIEHKPNPEPILKGMAMLQAHKDETVYIGDHENDMISAKKAGCLTCAVSYSLRLEDMLKQFPDYVIDDLENVKDFI